MATHEQNIQNLRDAVLGEQVRSSMIELFDEDYGLVKKSVGVGTDISAPTSPTTGYYDGNIYINTSTMDIWQMDGYGWNKIGNLKSISDIDETRTTADAGENILTVTFTDGTSKNFVVRNGSKGSTGVSITGAVDNKDGTFYLTMSNGTNTGNIETIRGLKGDQGIQGVKGDPGENGRGITSVSSANSGKNHILSANYTDGTSSVICTVRDGNDGSGTGDMLKETYDTQDRGYVDFAEQLTDGANSVTVTDVRNKADKATTLAGYGISNAYTKDEVDGLIDGVQPTWSNIENKPFTGISSTFFETTASDNLSIAGASISEIELADSVRNKFAAIPAGDKYDALKDYAKDELCIYNNVVYRSKVDNNQGMSVENTTYWEATTLGAQIGNLKQTLNNKIGGETDGAKIEYHTIVCSKDASGKIAISSLHINNCYLLSACKKGFSNFLPYTKDDGIWCIKNETPNKDFDEERPSINVCFLRYS